MIEDFLLMSQLCDNNNKKKKKNQKINLKQKLIEVRPFWCIDAKNHISELNQTLS